MKFRVLSFTLLSALPCHAALIASWNQNELSGGLNDSTSGHAPAVLVTGGSVDYGQPGVPNGTYGAIAVTAASGTSIGYGPNASDDYFISGADNNNPVMNIDRTGAFTVMSWIRPLAPDIARTYRPLSTGSSTGTDRGWGLGLRLNDSVGASAAVRFTAYGVADNDSALFSVVLGEWVHIAASYNNGAIDYFLNGNLVSSSVITLFGNDGLPARLTIGGRLGNLAGGAGGNDGDQVNGWLDGVRVYNEVMTPAQIQAAAIGSVSIPEPATAALAAFCAAGLLRRRRVMGA